MGHWSCQLPCSGEHKVPTQPYSPQKRKPLCGLNPATVFLILKMVTSSQDTRHPSDMLPAKNHKRLSQEREESYNQQTKPRISRLQTCESVPGHKPFYLQLKPHTQAPPGPVPAFGSWLHSLPVPSRAVVWSPTNCPSLPTTAIDEQGLHLFRGTQWGLSRQVESLILIYSSISRELLLLMDIFLLCVRQEPAKMIRARECLKKCMYRLRIYS